jgi:hypothetical protein
MTEATVQESSYKVLTFPAAKLPTEYQALVFSKWLRSLRFGNPLFQKVSSNDYYQHYHAYIQRLLDKPDSIVRLAVLSDDSDVVLGFCVSREDVLDYVHVHKDQRHQGICSKLVPESITTITHLTKDGLNILENCSRYKLVQSMDNKPEDKRCFVFNPFA